MRAYANIADELDAAGYSPTDIARIKTKLDDTLNLREIIRKASNETIDLKAYEADMRHLIDTYIEASEPRKISPFDEMPLLEIIVKVGIDKAINNLPKGLKNNKQAVAETIENNIRSTIVKESLRDPAFYAKMSALLDEIIEARKQKAVEYEDYLKQVAELVKKVAAGQAEDTPEQLNTPGRRALYNLLRQDILTTGAGDASALSPPVDEAQAADLLELVTRIDERIKVVRPDAWRDNGGPKEQQIKAALYGILQDVDKAERIFLIIKEQPEY